MSTPNDTSAGFDFSQLAKVVADLQARGGNISELTPVIAEDLLERVITQFESESGFTTGPWEPLKPGTIARRRQSASISMLRDTGVLFGSLTAYSDADTAEAFTNNPVAKYHVSREPRKVLPLRDFMDINFEEAADYAEELLLAEILSP